MVYDTIKAGKKAYLFSMEEIVTCLKTKDISPSAMTTYNKILRADLLAINVSLLEAKRSMEKAVKEMDFVAAAAYRDEMTRLKSLEEGMR